MANILVDVSGWYITFPREKNVTVEWCLLGDFSDPGI